ncbi:hypothetical protein HUZ36_16495 [Pseudoalteromonas sp. McH1-7]|uniref:Uncharacterized protein n=1 Tax=Pseudoalteromonas peptidolytica F12-50-A1 TaxID=1315280 RepID=A0A8I0N0X8_9GAMM|nr:MULTISPECIES: hypothetical protein [Pseudoalteromonas]MBE0348524.1 hypothetical protein [Pseudoalteromonas peptidolytica F12-50-A1]NLR17021.1 hypothetical protein [Pseudoalteromonas peptidolytica]NUZ12384.1 hypothetical protein [Pseudoalteromonas sp. McH1-7]RRS08236.1 hypothetical protein EAG18_13110 [Pseudoalteromonas sp. J010]RXF06461.1 hypothetical protein D9603_01825 [Pseudoalteromonas sp. PS5]
MSDNTTLPTGLISYIYNVTNDEALKQRATDNLAEVMAEFDLTADQKRIITEISLETGLTDDLWDQLSAELRPEIQHTIKTIW